MSVNPFDEILSRLSSIDQQLSVLLDVHASAPDNNDSDTVSFKQALEILHLSEDRLYAIHKTTFNTNPGKKLVFFKKELEAYLKGEKIQLKKDIVSTDLRPGKSRTKKIPLSV